MRLAAIALLLTVATAQAQTPDSTAAPPDTVALPPVSVDPLTGEVATDPAPSYRSPDARIVRAVYRFDQPPFSALMRAANESSYPVFIGVAPVAGAVALARGSDYRPAARLLATEAGTTAIVFALKGLLRRPRPYRTMTEIVPRDRHYTGEDPFDPNSFPSGHAALSFAIATSLTLSDGRLAAPAYAWATAVSVARVWHGVHYPSDVIVGAALGAGTAVVVHLLPFPAPGGGVPDGELPRALPVRIVVPL